MLASRRWAKRSLAVEAWPAARVTLSGWGPVLTKPAGAGTSRQGGAARGGRAAGVADGHATEAGLTGIEGAVAVEVVPDGAADAGVTPLGEEVVGGRGLARREDHAERVGTRLDEARGRREVDAGRCRSWRACRRSS